jgi:hypothetical protein
VVDGDGKLVDGRNRLEACKRAGVEPQYERLNGHDPLAFIVSANIARRNLSKSQQAMALAMLYPTAFRGRGKIDPAKKYEESSGFSGRLVEQARTILRHSTELAADVLHRGKHFDVALKEARDGQQERRAHDTQLAELRSKAPDVAAMVEDGRSTIGDALDELSKRQREVRLRITHAQESVKRFANLLGEALAIESAVIITDDELAMIGVSPRDFNPLAGLSLDDLDEAAAAVAKLQKLKNGEVD